MSTVLALAFSIVTFFSTMGGGIAALRWRSRVPSLMACAGGVVLAAAFFDLLPEATQRATDIHMALAVPLGATLVGYLLFHFVDRFVHAAVHGDDLERPSAAGAVGALGFVIHSFFDGLAIGLGFRIASAVGFLIALAVIGHDFSDGLNTVSYLTAHRHPAERSRRWLVADALTPLLGALVASFTPVPPQVFPLAIGFFSGLFIYAATESLLPQSRELALGKSLAFTLGGAAVMFLITRLA